MARTRKWRALNAEANHAYMRDYMRREEALAKAKAG